MSPLYDHFWAHCKITNFIRMHFKKLLSRIWLKRNPYSMMFHISYTAGVHVSVRFSLTITSVKVVWEHLPILGKNGVPAQFDIFMACCETYQTNLLYSEVAFSLVHFLSLVKCWPQFQCAKKVSFIATLNHCFIATLNHCTLYNNYWVHKTPKGIFEFEKQNILKWILSSRGKNS